ncbi:MAG TPA: sulfite exporter TauE/SafE family protein [Gammaproteobacteria bacterium]|nr:sulfite exporter TauE/SafE family protein [Gammaproteobacteria bacterium]
MTELALAAALVAGLAGSGHCLAMCGGMAGLLAGRRSADGRPLRRTLAYNLGRVFTYSLGGFLAGLLGHAVGAASGLGVAAGHLRILSGFIIVLAGLYLLTGRRVFAPFEKLGEKTWSRIAPLAVRQLQKDGMFATTVLGMLWGWLPCGMTWSMLAVAAASASPLQGAAIMAAFGLGTLPAMLAAGLAGMGLRGLMNRRAWRQGAAVLLIAAGVWTAAMPVAQLLPGDGAQHAAGHHAH